MLTAEDLKIVKEIYEKTGILTVKDKTTGGNPAARPYGEKYHPSIKHLTTGRTVFDENVQCERTIIRHFPDSTVYPGGIPIGNTARYQRHQLRDFGGDESFRYIGGVDDICTDEFKRIRALAYGKPWITAEERDRDAKNKEALRAKRVLSDLDPTSATGNAIAASIVEALKAFSAQKAAPAMEAESAVAVLTEEAGADAEKVSRKK